MSLSNKDIFYKPDDYVNNTSTNDFKEFSETTVSISSKLFGGSDISNLSTNFEKSGQSDITDTDNLNNKLMDIHNVMVDSNFIPDMSSYKSESNRSSNRSSDRSYSQSLSQQGGNYDDSDDSDDPDDSDDSNDSDDDSKIGAADRDIIDSLGLSEMPDITESETESKLYNVKSSELFPSSELDTLSSVNLPINFSETSISSVSKSPLSRLSNQTGDSLDSLVGSQTNLSSHGSSNRSTSSKKYVLKRKTPKKASKKKTSKKTSKKRSKKTSKKTSKKSSKKSSKKRSKKRTSKK